MMFLRCALACIVICVFPYFGGAVLIFTGIGFGALASTAVLAFVEDVGRGLSVLILGGRSKRATLLVCALPGIVFAIVEGSVNYFWSDRAGVTAVQTFWLLALPSIAHVLASIIFRRMYKQFSLAAAFGFAFVGHLAWNYAIVLVSAGFGGVYALLGVALLALAAIAYRLEVRVGQRRADAD